MSQHYFDAQMGQNPVQVLMGYDRRLDYFHLTVRDLAGGTGEGDSGVIYSSMSEPDVFDKDLGFCCEKLEVLGIQIPATMLEEVELDGMFGDYRVMRHFADGRSEHTVS